LLKEHLNLKGGIMVDIRNIMCAVDFSEMSPKVASYVLLLAKSLNASVKVVHVAPSLSQYVGFHGSPSSIEGFVEEIVSEAEKKMEAFIQEHLSEINVTGKVISGYADEEILSLAGQGDTDLIVMGTHGRRGIDRVLFGSVAERVVKKSPVPVLTIRP
jgi:nucleotide-binding universal stress UspA family protein